MDSAAGEDGGDDDDDELDRCVEFVRAEARLSPTFDAGLLMLNRVHLDVHELDDDIAGDDAAMRVVPFLQSPWSSISRSVEQCP